MVGIPDLPVVAALTAVAESLGRDIPCIANVDATDVEPLAFFDILKWFISLGDDDKRTF